MNRQRNIKQSILLWLWLLFKYYHPVTLRTATRTDTVTHPKTKGFQAFAAEIYHCHYSFWHDVHIEYQKEYPIFVFTWIGKKYGDENMIINWHIYWTFSTLSFSLKRQYVFHICKGGEDEEEDINSYWMTLRNFERGCIRSHSVPNSLWMGLWTCRKTNYVMNVTISDLFLFSFWS